MSIQVSQADYLIAAQQAVDTAKALIQEEVKQQGRNAFIIPRMEFQEVNGTYEGVELDQSPNELEG